MKVTTMRALNFLMVGTVMLLNACSNYPSAIDESFGASFRQTVIIQTANPDAPLHTDTLAPSDGQSAKSAVDRYQKSFDVLPLPTNVFNIGVGSGTGGTAR
jgi:type IV pilus biogenesis protein CpaD/CtpE